MQIANRVQFAIFAHRFVDACSAFSKTLAIVVAASLYRLKRRVAYVALGKARGVFVFLFFFIQFHFIKDETLFYKKINFSNRGAMSSDTHTHLFLQWLSILRCTDAAVHQYRDAERKFISCLARDVWDLWQSKANGLDLFEAMHARCTQHGKDYTKCKHIDMVNEKDVILMLTRMSRSEAYACSVLEYADANPGHYKAPSKMRVRQCEKTLCEFANNMIRNYMRMAIWKEHLSQPLTLLESFLCCSDGIERLELSRAPNVWNTYMRLKRLPRDTFFPRGRSETTCCRQCGSKKVKLQSCRECHCVYFCAQGYCARNSREDYAFGHTKEECELFTEYALQKPVSVKLTFKGETIALIQTLAGVQKKLQTQSQ